MFVKTVYKNQRRKFKINEDAKFEDVIKELVRCYGEQVRSFEIAYIDEENELIRIINNDEWEVCVEESSIKNKGKQVNTIEIHLNDGTSFNTTSNQDSNSFTQSVIVAPIENEETKADALDWKIINQDSNKPEVSNENPKESVQEPITENMQTSIFEELPVEQEQKMLEEPINTEEPPKIPVFRNDSQEDMVLSLKFDGSIEELEKTYRTIAHQFAPHAGFEVEECLLTAGNECTDLKKRDEKESSLDQSRISDVSSISHSMREEIESLIDEKLKKFTEGKRDSFSKKSEPTTVNKSNYNHGHVYCDNCQKPIINSCRFKSLVKYDYDLCERCEATGVHPEPMIKIREPLPYIQGSKLNSNFETLKKVFVPENNNEEAPKPQEVKNRLLCHIRNSRESMIEKAENALKEVSKKVTEPKKEEEPKKVEEPKQSTPRLCHIRPAKVETPKPEEPKKINCEVEKILNTVSRILPHLNTKKIKECIENHSSLSIDEIINKVLDSKF